MERLIIEPEVFEYDGEFAAGESFDETEYGDGEFEFASPASRRRGSGSQPIQMPPLVVRPCPKLPLRIVIDGYAQGATNPGPAQATALHGAILSLLRSLAKGCPQARRVTIVGHGSTEGSDATNTKVGQKRADAIKGQLESSLGILQLLMPTPVLFNASSAGESKPLIKPEKSEADRRRNRRVEVVIQP